MTPETSLLSELLSGSASATQYAGVAVLAFVALLGLWWHLDDAKRSARRRLASRGDMRPCATCFIEKEPRYYSTDRATICLDCEAWFDRRRKAVRS